MKPTRVSESERKRRRDKYTYGDREKGEKWHNYCEMWAGEKGDDIILRKVSLKLTILKDKLLKLLNNLINGLLK